MPSLTLLQCYMCSAWILILDLADYVWLKQNQIYMKRIQSEYFEADPSRLHLLEAYSCIALSLR